MFPPLFPQINPQNIPRFLEKNYHIPLFPKTTRGLYFEIAKNHNRPSFERLLRVT